MSPYGSPYGSYSSMRTITMPMDIPSRSSHKDASCAFPSWPRRSSLSESDSNGEQRATSYLSDEDLFLPTAFDDDVRSVSSFGSTASPQLLSPNLVPVMSEEEIEEMRRENAARQKELLNFIMGEKERRRQAAKTQKQRRGSSGSSSSRKTSPKSKLTSMTPIAE